MGFIRSTGLDGMFVSAITFRATFSLPAGQTTICTVRDIGTWRKKIRCSFRILDHVNNSVYSFLYIAKFLLHAVS